MKNFIKLLSAALIVLVFNQVALAADVKSQKDIIYIAQHDKNLSTLVKAIKAAGLVDTLKGAGPFTVFAPTNAAFAKLPKGTLDSLLKNKTQLVAVLTYHVVPANVMAADIQNGPVNTVEGQPVTLNKDGSMVTVNNAKVVKADIVASNGVIHEVDAVLLPPAKEATGNTTGN